MIGRIITGEVVETKPDEPKVKRDFVVKQTFTQKMGKRSVTIQEVEPPVIEAEPELTEQQDIQLDQFIVPIDPEKHISPEFIIVTATVYGSGKDTRSEITLIHRNKKCVALSRADFRIMSGFNQFKANGRPYQIISHIVGADASGQQSSANQLSTKRRIPATGFLVTEIDKGNQKLRQIMSDLHKLYQIEQRNLRSAYESRQQNNGRAKSSEPDKPMTIRFWKRDMKKEKIERGAK